MTQDGLSVLVWLMENLFKFFTSWKIPGTGVTPATWFIFLLVAGIVFNFIKKFLSQDMSGGD